MNHKGELVASWQNVRNINDDQISLQNPLNDTESSNFDS